MNPLKKFLTQRAADGVCITLICVAAVDKQILDAATQAVAIAGAPFVLCDCDRDWLPGEIAVNLYEVDDEDTLIQCNKELQHPTKFHGQRIVSIAVLSTGAIQYFPAPLTAPSEEWAAILAAAVTATKRAATSWKD